LVEDEPELRRVVVRLLTHLNYQVAHASDADRALELLGDPARRIDLLLTDVMMPGRFDGFALARRARELRPELPIVLVSGYPDAPQDGAWQALPKGGLAFVKKPFDTARLALLLRELLAPSPKP
jgi:CheY-like chemotaxis protein